MKNKMIWKIVILILLIGAGVFLSVRAEQKHTLDAHIAAAEKLITAGNYYEAILTLKPLLISNKKSQNQEDALWLAHTLMLKWEQAIIEEELWGEATDEKIEILNQFGANFDNIEINFGYRYGFLQRLIDTYPNTLKKPFAEYALIQSGYPVPQDDKTLDTLHAYIVKYEKTGRAEVYKVYLDIAHYHHGLWAMTTFSDHPEVTMFGNFGSEDPEKDRKLADRDRDIALEYYAKFYLNPYVLTDGFDYAFYGFKNETGYQLLKRRATFGWQFLLFGC